MQNGCFHIRDLNIAVDSLKYHLKNVVFTRYCFKALPRLQMILQTANLAVCPVKLPADKGTISPLKTLPQAYP